MRAIKRSFPKLVGIVNVTPDSFSDGGNCASATAALARVREMIADGAAVVDIGAESTRPGATPLTHEQEWERLAAILPEACRIGAGEGAAISVDTRHAETAMRARHAARGGSTMLADSVTRRWCGRWP